MMLGYSCHVAIRHLLRSRILCSAKAGSCGATTCVLVKGLKEVSIFQNMVIGGCLAQLLDVDGYGLNAACGNDHVLCLSRLVHMSAMHECNAWTGGVRFSWRKVSWSIWLSSLCFEVVLEGQWREGFMAIAAIGATNVGSIKLVIEPEFRSNKPKSSLLHSEPPEEQVYEPEGIGVALKKGEEIAAFNMGSTVVLVFQAPISGTPGKDGLLSEFKFCIRTGDRIRMGEAIGRWESC